MLDQHAQASAAEIAFYAPTIFAAVYLLMVRHGSPKMPWLLLALYCGVRIACGAVVIILQNKPDDVNLIIATHVLLNAGCFPLIAVSFGLLYIIKQRDFADDKKLKIGFSIARILFLTGIGLVIGGGVLESNYKKPSQVSMGYKLTKAGYICVSVFEAALIWFQVYFFMWRRALSQASKTVNMMVAIAVPFLIVRIAYLYLPAYEPKSHTWNVLVGPIVPYVVMGLVMEFVCYMIYIVTGFLLPPSKNVPVQQQYPRKAAW